MAETFLERFAQVETAANAPATPVGGYFRTGVIMDFDHAAYTATVQVGSTSYENVQCLQQIREDLLTVGRLAFVMLAVIGASESALVVGTFGERPPRDPLFGVIEGHGHRIGVPGDGKPISQGDIVP